VERGHDKTLKSLIPAADMTQATRPICSEQNMSAMPHSSTSRLPRDVEGWVATWRHAEIPVLAQTSAAIEDLREHEDEVNAKLLAETIADDPLMCLKLLAHVSAHRSSRRVTDAETATAALVMLGIGPFFKAFGLQPTVEDHLAGQPQALQGLRAVLRRAQRAAAFALGFAVHRMDHDAEVIHQAVLLHDFAEMLLWCHAPHLALSIAQAQRIDPTLRSSVVQRSTLGVELAEVQQGLMKAWRLPELLVRISDDRHAVTPQVRNVQLAIRVARHTATGWDNAALPDDVRDIAALLNLGQEPALKLLRELDS
jgi:HD-like signal output (HDOD) protein